MSGIRRIIGHVVVLELCPSLAEYHIPDASVPRSRNALSFLFLSRPFIPICSNFLCRGWTKV